ncbi:PepSY domain-containing protein [Nesterenkonia xinjiangensis]|uniref:Putative membrane protein YkoI n=1 Tax=Nesterenkonia xinjiangensis TaxID=225327 RepID=A0A7Z0KAR6_9MICC|nr:hypothetical protein [Nesterenkonia xinjiangensis]NYJ79173.1 putative membrane protein YkoI [Nesterenkonia xinjiangensis]
MFSASRSSAALVAIAVSASLLAGCGSPDDDAPEQPDGVDEDETLAPSTEPSAENPHDADDIDLTRDVALQAVNTALGVEEGKAVAFDKTGADETGMTVDILVDGEEVRTVVTNQEGTADVETLDGGGAEESLQEVAPEAEVPMLRAMQIARTESSGLVLDARLEGREGDLVVWTITVEGATSENTVIVDARNGAIVPEGDNPVEDNNIGGDPDTVDEDSD